MKLLKNNFKNVKIGDFVCKANDLNEMEILMRQGLHSTKSYKIVGVWEMTVAEWNGFTNNFFADYDFLKGKGGSMEVNGKSVISAILVKCGKKSVVVNPEGYDYPRYIAKA